MRAKTPAERANYGRVREILILTRERDEAREKVDALLERAEKEKPPGYTHAFKNWLQENNV